jgi:hypothetical protein
MPAKKIRAANDTPVGVAVRAQAFSLPVVENADRMMSTNKKLAWALALVLPAVCMAAALFVLLPVVGALFGLVFLTTAFLNAYRGIKRFTGKTLRLLVSGRVAVVATTAVLILGGGFGVSYMVTACAVVWLVADRLLGRLALARLEKEQARVEGEAPGR